MHEWMGDHTNYDFIIPYLNKKDYKWIFVDLRGYGLSKHIAGEFTCREAADDIHRLVENLKLNSYSLIGHSMSAMIAQRILVDVPNKIDILIAVTPVSAAGVSLEEKDIKILREVIYDDSYAKSAIKARTGERYNDTALSFKLSLARNASIVQAREGYLDMFLDTDFSSEIKGLNVPVRIIVGEHDIPTFKEEVVAKSFSQFYSDLRIVKFLESVHYPMLECPILFASTIEHFLSEIYSSRLTP
jgi:pimeloyl-ACP methyl ester carboxylesterase